MEEKGSHSEKRQIHACLETEKKNLTVRYRASIQATQNISCSNAACEGRQTVIRIRPEQIAWFMFWL